MDGGTGRVPGVGTVAGVRPALPGAQPPFAPLPFRPGEPQALRSHGRSIPQSRLAYPLLPGPLSALHPHAGSPITQNGFRANLSRPLQPRYRQQQPAAQMRTKYSTPNTTMVTISCRGRS